MTASLSASLATIETELRRMDRRVLLCALQPGIAVRIVQATIQEVGLAVIRELEALRGWHDGTSTTAPGLTSAL